MPCKLIKMWNMGLAVPMLQRMEQKVMGVYGASASCLLCAQLLWRGMTKNKTDSAPVLQVTELGTVIPTLYRTHNAIFVHLADALWTPEISITDPVKRAGISLSCLTSERLALKCTFCGQGGGAVMCVYLSCPPLMSPPDNQMFSRFPRHFWHESQSETLYLGLKQYPAHMH